MKTCGWAIRFPEADSLPQSFVRATGGGIPDEDGPGTDFYIEDLGFPTASGGQIGQSFPTGPRTSTVVTLFYFYGFGYHSSGPLPVWSTAPHSAPGNRFFGDDAFPANLDPIMGYGSLGFGTPGATPCPINYRTPRAAPPGVDARSRGSRTARRRACGTATGSSDSEPLPAAAGLCVLLRQRFLLDADPGRLRGCRRSVLRRCVRTKPLPATGRLLFRRRLLLDSPRGCLRDAGGAYYGGPCTPNPCPQPPTGACCFINGVCSLLTQAVCSSSGGVFLDGACEPNPCPQPGACCFPNGFCATAQEVACSSAGGAYYGGPCTPNPCPQPPPEACCFDAGICSLLTPVACAASGGVYHGGACEPNPCPLTLSAACCAPDGACSMTTQSDCQAPSVWHSDWPTCTPNPCPQIPPSGDGDTFANAFNLPGIPCTVTGTTVGYNNDYDEVCPYSGSTSPDVVYDYIAAAATPPSTSTSASAATTPRSMSTTPTTWSTRSLATTTTTSPPPATPTPPTSGRFRSWPATPTTS